MRFVRLIRENPLTVLCLALMALIAWVAVDLLGTPRSKPVAETDSIEVAEALVGIPSASTVDPVPIIDDPAAPGGLPPASAAVLPLLKPGMTRMEVEGLLGPPAADQVHPITVVDGRATYRTAYEIDEFGTPPTIRPIVKLSRALPKRSAGASVIVALEFDASRPGHPLLEIVYPDPLF